MGSTNQRGTYTVKVHRRKYHTHTEFPNANCDFEDHPSTPQHGYKPSLPRDNSQILGLRSDPSVASLLDMYDEHGQLPSMAFSDSPPLTHDRSRAQTRRNGSTLRELLGNPPSLNSRGGNDRSAMEGDISWAERFLG